MSIPDEADESRSAEIFALEGITYYAVPNSNHNCHTKDGQRCSLFPIEECYLKTRCPKEHVMYVPHEQFLLMRLRGEV